VIPAFVRFLKKNPVILSVVLLFFLHSENLVAADSVSNSVGLTDFAFSTYLGSGFYTTSGQNVFVLQIPLDYTIKQKTDTEAGWLLKLPITVGLYNFEKDITQNAPGVSDIGTLTFLPGIEYQRPITPDWTVIPFADYGFARDLSNTDNILVIGAGVKSYYNLHIGNNILTLGNRFLYARAGSRRAGNSSDYALIETGLNYRVASGFSFKDKPFDINFYYINFYYPNTLVLLEETKNPVRVGIENEVGITLSNLPNFLFVDNPQIGLGVRFGNNVTAYRIVFGMPF
jgi:hypothetical protein